MHNFVFLAVYARQAQEDCLYIAIIILRQP